MNKAKFFLIFLPILFIGNKELSQKSNLLPNSFFNFFNQKVYANDLEQFYRNRCHSKDKSGDYLGAIQDCNKAIEINPNEGTTYTMRGDAKAGLKDYSGAMSDYNRSLSINGLHHFLTYASIGYLKYDIKDYKGSIEIWNKVIEDSPSWSIPYLNIGNAKIKLKDYVGAKIAYKKAIERDPNSPDAYVNLMKLKGELLKPKEACLYGRQAINLGYQNQTLVKYICDFAAKYKP